MKIRILNESKQSLGGGFTFSRTFTKYVGKLGHDVAESDPNQVPGNTDILLISGASMLTREGLEAARKSAPKAKLVLRVDNIPRNSRNRNSGTYRLKDFSDAADLVIYQSDFAKNYISPFLNKQGPVIMNGADHEVFKREGPNKPRDAKQELRQYLYVQFNRDETKEWHRAWFEYQMLQRAYPGAHLWIVGNFSPELQASNFDFFMGEKFHYWGIVDDPEEMAEIYRGADWLMYSYFNDACSNTLIEALLCGCHAWGSIEKTNMGGLDTGGAPQIAACAHANEHIKADRMVEKYLEQFSKLL